ncbi:MAG: HD domain-containing protein [Bacteroidales bacterium]|nr:HD domain-containing protein [Bacteroidales bacterium]
MLNYANRLDHGFFKTISQVCAQMNVKSFVIGGFVRDILLDRPSKDVDVVVLGSGIAVASKVAEALGSGAHASYFKSFGTAMVRQGDWIIEFVGARRESYRTNSRKPIVEDGSLSDDQNRRDFTINALSLSLQPKDFGDLRDPFNGIQDIENKIIRTPLDPDITFSDDPLRMMRAIRFATQLNFTIEKNTFEALGRNKNRIRIVSPERVLDELNLIVMSPKPSVGFKLLEETGILGLIFPQFVALKGVESVNGMAHKDNFYHTLEVLDNLSEKSDNLWLRWSAILHDIAKPVTKRFEPKVGWTFHGHEFIGAKMVPGIFKQLKLPQNEKLKYVQKMVQLHLRPIVLAQEIVTDSAIRRLLFDAGDDIDDLMMLCDADITSKNEARVKRYLKNFQLVRQKLKDVEARDKIRNWQPPVTGEAIMETFGLSPSKTVGDLKSVIREAILDGVIGNNFEEAYAFLLEEGKKKKLHLKKLVNPPVKIIPIPDPIDGTPNQ